VVMPVAPFFLSPKSELMSTEPVTAEKLREAIAQIERLVVQDGETHLPLLKRLRDKLDARLRAYPAQSRS
jgi:hypothetical protein